MCCLGTGISVLVAIIWVGWWLQRAAAPPRVGTEKVARRPASTRVLGNPSGDARWVRVCTSGLVRPGQPRRALQCRPYGCSFRFLFSLKVNFFVFVFALFGCVSIRLLHSKLQGRWRFEVPWKTHPSLPRGLLSWRRSPRLSGTMCESSVCKGGPAEAGELDSNPASTVASYVIMGNILNVSEPQRPDLPKGRKDAPLMQLR